jgi:hypothetical protein
MRITSALLLLPFLSSSRLRAQAHFPWTAADPAPAVAGVHLGASRAALAAALGTPSDSQVTAAFTVLHFATRGLVIRSATGGLAEGIYLSTPQAGSLGGIKVGDAKADVTAKWGPPTTTQGPNAAYVLPHWSIVVQWDPSGTRVAQIALSTTG